MKGCVFMYGHVSVVLESCTTKHLTFNETLTQAESITVRFKLCSFGENTVLRGHSAQPGANHLTFYRSKDFVDFASNETSGLFFEKNKLLLFF